MIVILNEKMSMLALWLENNKIILRDDVSCPIPEPGEALIKILYAGICNTDLELVAGYYPFTGVIGHEFVGEVLSGSEKLRGKRVVGEINLTCGQCLNCLRHLSHHCEHRTVLGIKQKNGAFSEYITLPEKNLHILPDTVSTKAGVFIEPLAAALEIQQQINIAPENKVLVIGDGKLGNLITQTLLLTGCDLWLLGRHPEKCQSFIVKGVRVIDEQNVHKHHFDIVIEATGNPAGFEMALQAVRPRGTIVLKSTYADSIQLNAATIVVNEIIIIGSRCGPFPLAIRLLANQLVEVMHLIDTIYPLSQALLAFQHAAQKGAQKILISN